MPAVPVEAVTIPQPTAPFSTPAPISMVNTINSTTPQPIAEPTPMPVPNQNFQQAYSQVPVQIAPTPSITQIPDTAAIINQGISTNENLPPTTQI